MKVLLISMPDIAPLIIHEAAIHMPSLGIASVGGNIDSHHQVYIIDLIRRRFHIHSYLTRIMNRIQPDIVGFSAMTWQYETCKKLIRIVKSVKPNVRIAIGGYHATLMAEEIERSPEAEKIDFIIRGEGEETFRRLVNALDGKDNIPEIPSLSYKENGSFVHNPRGGLLDLVQIKMPIRDKRRLTWGYHIMYSKIEVMETSRGCTRSCNFCSMNHMYGRNFRGYPVERVIADLDDIYYRNKTRWVFIVDDNMVLHSDRVIELCDAIIRKKYINLNIVVQADCISMARNETMVRKMGQAGFKVVFLGIENASEKNLMLMKKGKIIDETRQAVAYCHEYGIMAMGGMIFGFPDDDEQAIIANYEFLNSLKIDAAYCQILTPYPKTGLRDSLMKQGLITNPDQYQYYNGLWANVKTRHLDSSKLQYLYWYHRQNILGWWDPSSFAKKHGKLWVTIWRKFHKPILKYFIDRTLRKYGWEGRYQREMIRLENVNAFKDLDSYIVPEKRSSRSFGANH